MDLATNNATLLATLLLKGIAVHALCAPLRALIVYYHRLAVKANWLTQTELAVKGSKRYLNRVVDAALKFQRQKDGDKNKEPTWIFMFGEMLAMSGDRHFIEHLSLSKIILEDVYQYLRSPLTKRDCRQCKAAILSEYHLYDTKGGKCYEFANDNRCRMPKCDGSLYDCYSDKAYKHCNSVGHQFEIIKTDPARRGQFQFRGGQWMIVAPDDNVRLSKFDHGPSDPTHYGHPFWIFCQWMESMPASPSAKQSEGDE
jgi:hypothetical protein